MARGGLGSLRPCAVAAIAVWAAVLGGCAGATSELSIATTSATGAAERIPSTLDKPEGPGPFAAVVIMHDCSGLGPRSSGAPDRWAKELVGRGYVTLAPDSFTTRGYPDGVCTDSSPRRGDVSPLRRNRDAYAALTHLRTLPFVDGRRIGLMGGSHGGSTTLGTMVAPDNDQSPQARERLAGFGAAVALYPGCAALASRVYRPVAPVLILIGEKDDWTPAEPCRALAAAAQQAGHPVSIKIYPGASHPFDSHNPVRYVAARV